LLRNQLRELLKSTSSRLKRTAKVPAEILEVFVPEAEEHLQIVQECLLALEANPNAPTSTVFSARCTR